MKMQARLLGRGFQARTCPWASVTVRRPGRRGWGGVESQTGEFHSFNRFRERNIDKGRATGRPNVQMHLLSPFGLLASLVHPRPRSINRLQPLPCQPGASGGRPVGPRGHRFPRTCRKAGCSNSSISLIASMAIIQESYLNSREEARAIIRVGVRFSIIFVVGHGAWRQTFCVRLVSGPGTAGVLFAARKKKNHNQQLARYKSICTKVYGAPSWGVRAPSGLNAFYP